MPRKSRKVVRKPGRRLMHRPWRPTSANQRFVNMARTLCPNHLTVSQHVSTISASVGVGSSGVTGNHALYILQGTTPVGFAMAFRLDDIPQFATFTALFDTYKILKVKLTFKPLHPNANLSTTSGIYVQQLLTTIDYDDYNVPLNADEIRDYQSCKDHDFYKKFTVELTPKVAVAAYGGAFTSFMQTRGYMDCSNPNVQHFGVKGMISAGNAGYCQTWNISAEYIIDFKNIR